MFAPAVGLSGYHPRVSAGLLEKQKTPNPKAAKSVCQKICHFIVSLFQKIAHFFQNLFKACSYSTSEVSYKAAYAVESLHKSEKEPYWILSLDGGGTKGVIPLQKLRMIEELVGKKISELFDCIAGSSTGGIITAGLCIPARYSAEEVQRRYMQDAQKIFTSSFCYKIASLGGMIKPKYPSPASVFQALVGDKLLRDCTATKMLITSVDLPTGHIVLFSNRPQDPQASQELQKMGVISGPEDAPVSGVVEATTAAPTYFKSKQMGKLNLADGGIALNNPAEIAVISALNEDEERPIVVLSLGDGEPAVQPITSQGSLNWGWAQWVSPLINYELEFGTKGVDRTLEFLHKIHRKVSYIRLQDILFKPSQNQLDNAKRANLLELTALAKKSFQHYLDNGGFEQLIQPLRKKAERLNA